MAREDGERIGAPHDASLRDVHANHPRLDRIVVGVDFEPPSLDALRWTAHTLAPAAELILLHAVERGVAVSPGEPRTSSEECARTEAAAHAALRAIADALHAERPLHVEVRADRAAAAIAHRAEAAGADLIVVGPHGGRESVRGIGGTAERLIRMAPVPVLLVANAQDRPVRHLVVPVDQVDLTPEVLRWADMFAAGGAASVTLAHVFDPRLRSVGGWPGESVRPEAADPHGYPGFDDYVRETHRWLAPLTRELSSRAPITTEVLVGDPGTEINALARREGAELIVMGRRGRWRRVPAVLGSTASTVLRGAPCPVCVVVDPPDARFDPWTVEA